jgi:hypothetical protein
VAPSPARAGGKDSKSSRAADDQLGSLENFNRFVQPHVGVICHRMEHDCVGGFRRQK